MADYNTLMDKLNTDTEIDDILSDCEMVRLLLLCTALENTLLPFLPMKYRKRTHEITYENKYFHWKSMVDENTWKSWCYDNILSTMKRLSLKFSCKFY